jgi:hypothetical protein
MELVKNLERVDELPLEGAVFLGVPNDGNGEGRRWICSSVFGPDRLEMRDYTAYIDATRRGMELARRRHVGR